MSVVSAADFMSEYPEFSDLTLARVQDVLDLCAEVYCPSSVWTDPIRQETAIKLRAAHQLEVLQQQIAESASIGAAVSQGQQANAKSGEFDELNQTAYGRQFKQLRRTLGVSGFTF